MVFFLFLFNIVHCSNPVNTCSISNVCVLILVEKIILLWALDKYLKNPTKNMNLNMNMKVVLFKVYPELLSRYLT